MRYLSSTAIVSLLAASSLDTAVHAAPLGPRHLSLSTPSHDTRTVKETISWLCDLPAMGRVCSAGAALYSKYQLRNTNNNNNNGAGNAVATVSLSGLGTIGGVRLGQAKRFTVPYAEPPTGTRRFRPPVAKQGWTGTRNGTALPPFCPQSSAISATPSSDEDCLFLNVYTPTTATASSNLPVFVWLHGGSFIYGGSADPALDASVIAPKGNMVVVTIQYRLGVLGFLRSPQHGVDGNMGLLDVIQALNFVQQNVRQFGGNPASVTLAGQSSGASIIKTLFSVRSAGSLFHRAILHSAPLNYGDHSVTTSENVGNVFVQTLTSSGTDCNALSLGTNAQRLSCLQSAKVDSVLSSQDITFSQVPARFPEVAAAEAFRPVIDGSVVQSRFLDSANKASGFSNRGRPIIFTTVKHEAGPTIAAVSREQVIPNQLFEVYVRALIDSRRADKVIQSGLYSIDAANIDTVRVELEQLGTDWIWRCANQQAAVNITLNRNAPQVYLAEFDKGIPYASNTGVRFCQDRVCHQDDIEAVFSTGGDNLSAAETALSAEVLARWSAFARTGSPNAGSYVQWSPVSASPSRVNLNMLVLEGSSSKIAQTQEDTLCSALTGFWGRVAPFDEQLFSS